MKLKLPDKEKFNSALRINRWPVNWFNEKKDKEDERKKRIQKLYPSVNKMKRMLQDELQTSLKPSNII